MPSLFDALFKKSDADNVAPIRTRKNIEESLLIDQPRTVGTLGVAFRMRRPPQAEERALLKRTLDILESTELGKNLLAETAEMGYKILMETDTGSRMGGQIAQSKQIILNPPLHTSEASLAATLCHELTHAVQQSRKTGKAQEFSEKYDEYSPEGQLKYFRSLEAGAWANEAAFIYEIKDKHPEVLGMARQYPTYNAYEETMAKSGDKGMAAEAAFKKWFEGGTAYKSAYDKVHTEFIIDKIKFNKGRNKKAMAKEMSNADILDVSIGCTVAKGKVSESFMNSPEACCIQDQYFESIQNTVEDFKNSFLIKPKNEISLTMMKEGGPLLASQAMAIEEVSGNLKSNAAKKSTAKKPHETAAYKLMKNRAR